MIRVEPPPKPTNFVERVEVRGRKWLATHPNASRPTDYWSEFKGALADGFFNLCGYSAMYEPVGTVDHFVSWNEDRTRAYDWTNYRFASGWINSSKQNVRANSILDPFEVENDWFEILLPSLQLVTTELVPEAERERASYVLRRLHLRDDERVVRQRREWYRMYVDGEITLDGLRRKAPLIARAIDKQMSELG